MVALVSEGNAGTPIGYGAPSQSDRPAATPHCNHFDRRTSVVGPDLAPRLAQDLDGVFVDMVLALRVLV